MGVYCTHGLLVNGGFLHLRNSQVTGSLGHGVTCDEDSIFYCEQSCIRYNNRSGVSLTRWDRVKLSDSCLWDNRHYGIAIGEPKTHSSIVKLCTVSLRGNGFGDKPKAMPVKQLSGQVAQLCDCKQPSPAEVKSTLQQHEQFL